MSPPSPYSSGPHAEASLSVEEREDSTLPSPGLTAFEGVREQIQLLPHPAQRPDVPASSPTTLHEHSVPGHVHPTIILHASIYVIRSLQTNAWGTRAIERAIGTGYALTIALLLLVKKRRLASNAFRSTWARELGLGGRPSHPGEERELFATLACALAPSIAGVGYHIRSLIMEGPPETPVYLMIASWTIVPNLVVVVMFFM